MESLSNDIRDQLWLMKDCLIMGGWFMLCYDLLRLSRMLFWTRRWLAGVQDFAYWIYLCIASFSLLYSRNDGVIRGFVVAGIFLGMLIYQKVISKNLLKLLQKCNKYIKIKSRK